jgi:hypothetical protein
MRLRTRLALVAAGLTLLGTVLGLSLTYLGLLNLRMAGFDDENRLLATLIAEVAVLREDQTSACPSWSAAISPESAAPAPPTCTSTGS